jgi:recombination associated protein RdgC
MQFKFFKNLHIFCFQSPVTLTLEALHEELANSPFRSCNQQEWFTMGWVPPFEQDNDKEAAFVYEANHCLLFTLRRQDKILPPATVRDFVKEKLVQLEAELGRKARKFEKEELKERIIFERLPQALPRNSETSAYIDLQQNWLVINTPSRKKAEEVVNFLRDSLGSLPVVPPQLQQSPAPVMTHWLRSQKPPTPFTLGEDCHLVTSEKESVTCKNVDLSSSAVQAHLKAGKVVQYLSLQWADRITFTLDEDFAIKRLKYLEIIPEQGEDVYADFTVMTGELTNLITQLFELFGVDSIEE